MKTILTTPTVLQNLIYKVCKELGMSDMISEIVSKNFNLDTEVSFHGWMSRNCVRCAHDPLYCEYWNPDLGEGLTPEQFISWRTASIRKNGYLPCDQLEPVNPSSDTQSDT